MKTKLLQKREKILLTSMIFFIILFLGGTCNIVVTKFNDGKMPVLSDQYTHEESYHKYYSIDDKPNFWLLSDIIPIGSNFIMSIGDVIVLLSGIGFSITFIYYGILYDRDLKMEKEK